MEPLLLNLPVEILSEIITIIAAGDRPCYIPEASNDANTSVFARGLDVLNDTAPCNHYSDRSYAFKNALSALSLTCRALYYLTKPHLYETILVQTYNQLSSLSVSLASTAQDMRDCVRHLVIPAPREIGGSPSWLDLTLPSLESFELANCMIWENDDWESIDYFIRKHANLKRVVFRQASFWTMDAEDYEGVTFPNVRELYLIQPVCGPCTATRLLSKFPNLRVLAIQGAHLGWFTDGGQELESLAACGSGIETLLVVGINSGGSNGQSPTFVLPSFPNVKHLMFRPEGDFRADEKPITDEQ